MPRPLRAGEAEKLREEIASVENSIEESAHDSRQGLLRSIMGVRGQELADSLTIRIVAFIAWAALASERSEVSVARVANAAAMGDMALHLEARRTIRFMLARNAAIVIRDSEFGGSQLLPGERLVKYLSGEGHLPVVWTEQSLREEKEDWERRKVGAAARRLPMARSTEHRLPSTPARPPLSGAQSPKAIFETLRKTVIGIDPIVRRFSIQMAMHLKRVAIADKGGVLTNSPVCVLCCGPSGSGKSFLATEFGRLSGLPFAIGDMSSVTASAYVGTSVDELFYGFARKGGSLADAQRGVLFLDEIDKKRTNDRGGDFDATGAGVQYELLRMLEGARIQVGGKRGNDSTPRGVIDTSSMAFVMGGAFSSISDALAEKTKSPLGFSGEKNGAGTAPDVRELLLEYFIPELVNRIGSVIVIPPPSHGQLVQIATANEGTIARLNQFFGDSFGLRFLPTPEAVSEIASWALETKTFARGMRNLCQSLAEEAIFEERQGEVAIEAGDVRRAIQGLKADTMGLKSWT